MAHSTCTEIELADDISEREDKTRERVAGISELVESINQDLKKVPFLPSNCSIYRVPMPLFKTNPNVYKPRLVSIGPFHRYANHLKPMEAHKLLYLKDFLDRRKPEQTICLEEYVGAMTKLENKARQCYSENIQLKTKDEFAKMMLIDGCFILELILKTTNLDEHRRPDDPIMKVTWMFTVIKYDLILLENQLPFFVLGSLYQLYTKKSKCVVPLKGRISNFFQDLMPHPQEKTEKEPKKEEVFTSVLKEVDDVEAKPEEYSQAKHLLHFVRGLLLPSPPKKTKASTNSDPRQPDVPSNPISQHSPRDPKGNPDEDTFVCIHCATELREANVNFKKEDPKKTHLLNMPFKNKELKIRTIKIQDGTESLLRNLIAFEQYCDHDDRPITSYASFMDDLINSTKDVALLVENGIIVNLLGEPKDVTKLFNALLKEVTIGKDDFSSVRRALVDHYKNPWHKSIASLKHNYFNTPWAIIACFAALLLFLLTVVQTICSILSLK